PHPPLPRFPSPTALIGCSFAEPPPRPHTPSLTARPGESRIASTQRAPAGGYVAVSPRQVDVPGTGPGSGRVAGPRIASTRRGPALMILYAPRLPRRVRQGPAGPHGRAILSDREQDGRGLALRFGRHHSRGRAGERRAPEVSAGEAHERIRALRVGGVSGICRMTTPCAASASSMAEASTAGTGRAPDSPTPLSPRGFSAEGVSRCSIRSAGTSVLRGSA